MTTTAARPATARDRYLIVLNSLDALPPAAAAPCIVLVSGLPGSGKSTFSRRLAPLIDAVILESDALRRLLFANPTHNATESGALFAAIYRVARTLLHQGMSVIIDATNLRTNDRRAAHKLADATGATLSILRLTAPESVIRKRLKTREAAGSIEAGIEVYERMAQYVAPIREPHRLIDSTNAAAYEAVLSEIANACRAQTRRGAVSPLGGSMGGRP